MRQTLEAMRLGVVPDTDLSAYTVGREMELELVAEDLKRVREEGGAVRAFLGDYGAGKTHLLELIREGALNQGFVTARVMLNPEETAPSHPKRVYRELVRSLEYPDLAGQTALGLRPLLERACQDEDTLDAFQVTSSGRAREELDDGAHLYLTPALRYYRAIAHAQKNPGRRLIADEIDDDEREEALTLLFHWLEGHPTISNTEIDDELRGLVGRQGRIYSMKDYRPWARIYGYLLSGLSRLCTTAGYEGLVVLVDEAEFYSLLSSANREYARNLFKALAYASVGDDGMVPFSREELDLGGMGILQDLPPRYHDESGLYTIFAMTPNAEGIEALQRAIPDEVITEIGRLEMDTYRQLVGRVTDHYRQARQDAEIPDAVEQALAKVVAGLLHSGFVENPRQAMKFIVEFLDLATTRREAMPEVIADLREMYL